jgi:protein gp37
MASQRDGISYCDETWNVTIGCDQVSSGCASCWAKGMVRRIEAAGHGGVEPTVTCSGAWNGNVQPMPQWLAKPLHWRRPRVVLVQTLGDLFHERVPFDFMAAVFGAMAACPHLTFLLLTKRPERMVEFHDWLECQQPTGKSLLECCSRALEYDSEDGLLHRKRCADPDGPWPLPNAWLGVSAENQKELEKRWDSLRNVPAAHYWLSLEPLLGPVTGLCGGCGCDANAHRAPDGGGCSGLFPDFVAVGPETGARRRPCDMAWIRSVVRQCQNANVPVHVKALEVDGRISHDPREWPEDLRVQDKVTS